MTVHGRRPSAFAFSACSFLKKSFCSWSEKFSKSGLSTLRLICLRHDSQVLQRKVGPCKRPSCSSKSKPQIRQEYGLERAMTNTGGNRCRRLEQKKGCGWFHHTLCHQKKSVTFDFLRGQSADKTNKTFHPSADNGIFFSFYPLLPRTSLPMSVFPADNRGHPRTIRGHPVFSTFHTDASSPNGPWR